MQTTALVEYIDNLLGVKLFKDYAPNGLQIQGAENIKKILGGVSATEALIDEAIQVGADTILVHHGYFWGGEDARIINMKARRIKKILANNINLIAYHLPLDAHSKLGNNAQLMQILGLEEIQYTDDATALLKLGKFAKPMQSFEFAKLIHTTLKRKPLHIYAKEDKVLNQVAICSGAAQDLIEEAFNLGADAFITGEVSERTTHFAQEMGIDFFAAGHHATETFGVKSLGEHLADKFKLDFIFKDIFNPV